MDFSRACDMEGIIVLLWLAYHIVVIAYFNYKLNQEEDYRAAKERARLQRLATLGFRVRQKPRREGEEAVLIA
ncbi:MAG: hypothetical protein ACREWG_07940 [Gammaproteobacteria bacterium]